MRDGAIRRGPEVASEAGAVLPQNAVVHGRWRRLVSAPEAGVFYALVVVVLGFAIRYPTTFATVSNIRNIGADASALLILAIATTFVILTANIDLSLGSVVAFAEVAGVRFMVAVGGSGWATCLAGLVAALVAGLGWGVLNGVLVSRLRIPSLIATLATLGMALGAADLLAGGTDIAQVPPLLVNDVGAGQLSGVPVILLVAAGVAILAFVVLRYTRFGRHTYAVGSDRVAAVRAGINVERHILRVYALAGLAYGLVAFLNLARFGTTNIGGHNADALNAVTAVALGGTSLFGGVGTILGTVIGVFIPAVLQNGLVIADVQPYWQQIAVGAALVAAVYADQVRRRRRSRG